MNRAAMAELVSVIQSTVPAEIRSSTFGGQCLDVGILIDGNLVDSGHLGQLIS